ncbi:MAG: AMP-binding protein, partial [Pseudomonadota bacterium]
GIMLTSGTTGDSKGVIQPHNMFARGASRAVSAFGMTESDIVHFWFPLFHIGGQLHFAMSTVLAGSSIALQERLSISKFWREVAEDQCTVTGGMSSTMNLLRNSPPEDSLASRINLRLGVYGPAANPDVIREFEERYGMKVVDTYGMTEAEIVTLPPSDGSSAPRSVGVLSPDFEMAFVDEDGHAVAQGEIGEILIRPAQPDVMMRGYYKMPNESLQAFRNLWFHTGDLGSVDEQGFIHIHDRKKHVIRRRGENISIRELESIFLSHPQVAECVALGVESPLGEDDVMVVVKPTTIMSDLDLEELLQWATANLPRFMIPQYLCKRSEIPLTDVGKPDRHQLASGADVTILDTVSGDFNTGGS